MEILRENRTRQRSTNRIPVETWDQALVERNGRLRPTPASSLLDLHFSLRATRRVNNDQTTDFWGQEFRHRDHLPEVRHHRTPSEPEILGGGPPAEGRLAAYSGHFRNLTNRPVLYRRRQLRILGLPRQRLAVVITVDYRGNSPIVGAKLDYGFTQTFRNQSR